MRPLILLAAGWFTMAPAEDYNMPGHVVSLNLGTLHGFSSNPEFYLHYQKILSRKNYLVLEAGGLFANHREHKWAWSGVIGDGFGGRVGFKRLMWEGARYLDPATDERLQGTFVEASLAGLDYEFYGRNTLDAKYPGYHRSTRFYSGGLALGVQREFHHIYYSLSGGFYFPIAYRPGGFPAQWYYSFLPYMGPDLNLKLGYFF